MPDAEQNKLELMSRINSLRRDLSTAIASRLFISVFVELFICSCGSTQDKMPPGVDHDGSAVEFADCLWHIPQGYLSVAEGEFNSNLSWINMLHKEFDQGVLDSTRKKNVKATDTGSATMYSYIQTSGKNEYVVHIVAKQQAYVRFAGVSLDEVMSISHDCL